MLRTKQSFSSISCSASASSSSSSCLSMLASDDSSSFYSTSSWSGSSLPLRRSSSSLCLQGREQSVSSNESFGKGNTQLLSLSSLSSLEQTSADAVECKIEAFQMLVLVILVAQIPCRLEEIRDIYDLQYHGVSSLILICLIRYLMGSQQKEKGKSRSHSEGSFTRTTTRGSSSSLMGSGSLNDSQLFEQQEPSTLLIRTAVDDSPVDEWGHFADWEESFAQEQEFRPFVPRLTSLESIVEEDE